MLAEWIVRRVEVIIICVKKSRREEREGDDAMEIFQHLILQLARESGVD